MKIQISIGGTLGNLLDTGLGVFQATQKPQTVQPKPVTQPAQSPAWLKPVLIGGGVLLAIAVAVFALKRK